MECNCETMLKNELVPHTEHATAERSRVREQGAVEGQWIPADLQREQ